MLSEFQFAKQPSVPTMWPVCTQAQNLWNDSQAHGSERSGEKVLLTLIMQIKEL